MSNSSDDDGDDDDDGDGDDLDLDSVFISPFLFFLNFLNFFKFFFETIRTIRSETSFDTPTSQSSGPRFLPVSPVFSFRSGALAQIVE